MITDENPFRFIILTEFFPGCPTGALFINSKSDYLTDSETCQHHGLTRGEIAKDKNRWKIIYSNTDNTNMIVEVKIPKDIFENKFRLSIIINGKPWFIDTDRVSTLGKEYYSPREFGIVRINNTKKWG